jgi:exosortase/archaeosortase family protein
LITPVNKIQPGSTVPPGGISPGGTLQWKKIPAPVRSFLAKAALFFIAWKILYLSLLLPGRTLDGPLTYLVGISTSKTLNAISHSGDYSAAPGVNTIGVYPQPGDQPIPAGERVSAARDNSIPSPDRPLPEKVMAVYYHNDRVLSIADVCNGLELMVLYAGLIICLPAAIGRKLAFIGAGILLIFLVNVLRCSALVFVYLHYRQYVEFFHHYVFTFLVYGFICWLWYLFSLSPGFSKQLTLNALPQ